MSIATHITPRNILFLLFNAVLLFVYYTVINDLLAFNELYSHIILIPFVSGYFIFTGRRKIFSTVEYSIPLGIPIIIAGSVLFLAGARYGGKLNLNDYSSIMSLAILIVWTGGLILFYGLGTFRRASFPVMFLILIAPVPSIVMDKIIFVLQSASAEVSYAMFQLTGVPIFREGFVFHLPGVTVEVAKECSGIRSSIALVITSILAGHLFLNTGWKKVVLILLMFPLTVLKNGIRIVTLSLLGAYVDMSFLTDSLLHKKGGIVFFITALILFTPVFWLLVKSEGGSSKGRPEGTGHG